MTKQEAENHIETMCLDAMRSGKLEEIPGIVRGMAYAYQTVGIFTGKDVTKIVHDFKGKRRN